MASTAKVSLLAFFFFHVSAFTCKLAKADDDHQAIPDQFLPGGNNEASYCFNNNYIYKRCGEPYRLSQAGSLNVPPGNVDEYCGGPCLDETNLVLNCIENTLGFSPFLFSNRATVGNLRDTIKSGCAYGPQRGNFNVGQYTLFGKCSRNGRISILLLVLCGLLLSIVF